MWCHHCNEELDELEDKLDLVLHIQHHQTQLLEAILSTQSDFNDLVAAINTDLAAIEAKLGEPDLDLTDLHTLADRVHADVPAADPAPVEPTEPAV